MSQAPDTPAAAAPRYPMHDKAQALAAERDTAQEFYDFLLAKGILLCRVSDDPYDRDDPFRFQRYAPCHISPEKLIAEFLGIDLAAFDAEKESMYAELVAANERRKLEAAAPSQAATS